MNILITYGISSLLTSILCVYLVRYLSRKFGWLAPISKDRWHKEPRALFGGVAIFFSFMVFGLIAIFKSQESVTATIPYIILFVGSTGCFLLGLFDDIYHFKPSTKIIGQIVFSSLFIIFGGSFQVSSWEIINILLSYFWFLGIINAINLLDNMDGLSSGVTIICSMILLCLMIISGHHYSQLPMIINIIFIMSVLGFWFFNKHPASIFMGDSGSLFLGYTLAALPTIPNFITHDTNIGYSSILTLLIPVTILAIPVFDTTLVALTRKFSGRAMSQGGKDHSSHRLVGLGFSEKTSVLILYALSLIGGITAILMVHYQDTAIFIFALYVVFMIVIGLYLGKIRIYSKDEARTRKSGWTPIVRQLMYKKRVLEVMLDIVLVSIAYFFSLYAFTGGKKELAQTYFINSVPAVIVGTILTFQFSKIYRGVWSLVSIEDIYIFAKSIVISVLVTLTINTFLLNIPAHFLLYFIFGLILFFLIVGSRLSFRLFDIFIGTHGLSKRPIKVLLYGAGNAGKLIIDEIKRNEIHKDINPIGFIDDDASKIGRSVSGIKIIGNVDYAISQVENNKFQIEEIWIVSRKIKMERVEMLKNKTPDHIQFKTVKLDVLPLDQIDYVAAE